MSFSEFFWKILKILMILSKVKVHWKQKSNMLVDFFKWKKNLLLLNNFLFTEFFFKFSTFAYFLSLESTYIKQKSTYKCISRILINTLKAIAFTNWQLFFKKIIILNIKIYNDWILSEWKN